MHKLQPITTSCRYMTTLGCSYPALYITECSAFSQDNSYTLRNYLTYCPDEHKYLCKYQIVKGTDISYNNSFPPPNACS